jgi:chemotaxis protein MotA
MKLDLGFLFGVLGTWVLLLWSLLSGGSLLAYWDFASFIMVVCGAVTIVFISLPAGVVMGVPKVLKQAFVADAANIEGLIQDLVSYAEIARRDGILSLENVTKDMKDPFIVRGIQMAVDGTDPELIEQILTTELDNLSSRHDTGKSVLDLYAKYAPAMGMIGTLVGLVVMLQNMDDPSKIGPGMAVALLTTLYGAVLANALCLPLSDRLAKKNSEEVLYKTIIIKGVMAIQSGDNPRVVEQKLRTFLPPSKRPQAEAA